MTSYDDDRAIANMVIKDIKILFDDVSAHSNRHRRGLFGLAQEREKTVELTLTLTDMTSKPGASKFTTNTKIDERGHVTYEEHITFDVRRLGPWKISFKCTDPEGVGIAAIIGEGSVDLPGDYTEIQHKFEPPLKNGDINIGKLSLNVFLLSPGPPPTALTKGIYGGERCGHHIGYFLIDDVECTLSDKFRAYLEWVVTRPQAHSTQNYYRTSDGRSRYPIIFELWAMPQITLEVVARHDKKIARMEVVLTSQAIWQKLIDGQTFEVKEALMENKTRRCMISFRVSCHGLIKFGDLIGSSPIPVTPKDVAVDAATRPIPLSTSPLEIGRQSISRSRSTSTHSSQSTWPASNDISLNGVLPDRPSPPSHSIDFTYPPQSSRTPSSAQARGRKSSLLDLPPSNIIVRDRYLLKCQMDAAAATHPLYMGEHLRTRDTFIVKIFPQEKAWVYETDLLVKLKGKHVVKLVDADKDHKYDLFFTVTVNYGENLEKELQRLRLLREDPLSQRELFKNICEAVRFVHSKNIVHLALEPSNILLKEDGSLKVRLCGFSRAKEVNSRIYRNDELNVYGTSPGFRSPELVAASGDIRATYPIDIFSLGCILYNIVSKQLLYESYDDLPRIPISALVSHNCHDQLVEDLLLKMLAKDPNERPSIEEVLRDAYFVGRPPSPYE